MEIISSTVVAFSRVWYHPLHQNSKFESVSDGRKTTVAQKGQSQISLPKHKTISQNTNQFSKTQISLPKHKTISQNTNQFTKTQINFSKHKPISSKNTNRKTGHLLCYYQGAWKGLIPRIFCVQHGDFKYGVDNAPINVKPLGGGGGGRAGKGGGFDCNQRPVVVFFDHFNDLSSNILLTFGCYFDNPQCSGVGHLNENSQLSSNPPPLPAPPPAA